MKKSIFAIGMTILAFTAFAEPRRVALVVQNHTANVAQLPMSAFADTLAARLSGETFRVINPNNVIGIDQNSTAAGEVMPEASAQEIGRMLGADGVITASILEFTSEDIGVPPVAYKLKVRLALNLMDIATGETVFGVEGVEFGKNYTAEKIKSDTASVYESFLHTASAKAADKLVAKAGIYDWQPNTGKQISVFFGCNVLGADIQIDGLSYGTCPAQLAVTPGVHNILVSYPPYYYDFRRRAMFNSDGQTFAIVLQITPEGEASRRGGELFACQKRLFDAELARYKDAGNVDDYIRTTIADGMATYWKNSCGRVVITDGSSNNVDFATPKVDGDSIQNGMPLDAIESSLKQLLNMQ